MTKPVKIKIVDDLNPEDVAMVQALYSRSDASVDDHLDKLQATGSSNFMSRYYIGYGHASIGDCGTTHLFIENVSILAAKVIQNHPLYNGQESSTRYIDFGSPKLVQGVDDVKADGLALEIQQKLLDFYNASLPKVVELLKKKHAHQLDGDNQEVFDRAINARAFDIMRGFLPAGVCTQLSWSTTLRNALEVCRDLITHPLEEIRMLSDMILKQLAEKYPSSFPLPSKVFKNADEEMFYDAQADEYSYQVPCLKGPATRGMKVSSPIPHEYGTTYLSSFNGPYISAPSIVKYTAGKYNHELPEKPTEGLMFEAVKHIKAFLTNKRPRGSLPPRHLETLGRFSIWLNIDYGSYRDLQRHRAGYCSLPILSHETLFNAWYMDSLRTLDYTLHANAHHLLGEHRELMRELERRLSGSYDVRKMQYMVPMGYNVVVQLDYSFRQMVYVAELRSGRMVHPTLRLVAHQMANSIRELVGTDLAHGLMIDDFPINDIDIRRGNQTITEKK